MKFAKIEWLVTHVQRVLAIDRAIFVVFLAEKASDCAALVDVDFTNYCVGGAGITVPRWCISDLALVPKVSASIDPCLVSTLVRHARRLV